MSKIKAEKWIGGTKVTRRNKEMGFYYFKPRLSDLKHEGRMLHIYSGGPDGACHVEMRLNGTQINTLKKILRAAGEM